MLDVPPGLAPASLPIIDHIQRRLQDLSSHQIPRLRECKGPLSVQQEIARELRGDIARLEQRIEELEEIADDQDTELERIEILEFATNLGGELSGLKGDFRGALLLSKRAIDANPSSKRDELLYSKNAQLNSTQTDDPIQEKANQVTAALRQTTELMKEELDRSVMTGQMLDESTSTLRSTTTLYQTYSSLLTTSNSLLTALEQANYLDRILILAALLFFVLVCLYILKKRILDKAVGGLTYWVGGAGGKAVGLKKGVVKGTALPSVAKSLVGAATAAASSSTIVAAVASRASSSAKGLGSSSVGGGKPETIPSSVLDEVVVSSSSSASAPSPVSAPTGEWDEAVAVAPPLVDPPVVAVVRDEL